ncbi:MAG: hypothetical protein U0835_20105 [Isosphaeraceae bacterium]
MLVSRDRSRRRRGMTVLEVILVLGVLVPALAAMLFLTAYAARLFHHLTDAMTGCTLM